MGMDSHMYSFRTEDMIKNQQEYPTQFTSLFPDIIDVYDGLVNYTEEVGYWRKFYGLHDWMEQLYLKKNGTAEFNCIFLNVTSDDLLQLRQDCKKMTFYAEQYYTKSDKDEKFYWLHKQHFIDEIDNMLGLLKSGYHLYFYSSY